MYKTQNLIIDTKHNYKFYRDLQNSKLKIKNKKNMNILLASSLSALGVKF